MNWGWEWRQARKRWAEDFWIWKKKQLLEIGRERKVVDFWSGRGQTRGLRDACTLVESVSWELTMYEQSAYEEIVSLSLLMSENLKLKKVNKSFVPEPISCFSDSYMYMNILWTYVHFTYSYLSRIFGPILKCYILRSSGFFSIYRLSFRWSSCLLKFLLFKPLATVSSLLVTVGIIVILMFQIFTSLAMSKCLFLFALSLILSLRSTGTSKFAI